MIILTRTAFMIVLTALCSYVSVAKAEIPITYRYFLARAEAEGRNSITIMLASKESGAEYLHKYLRSLPKVKIHYYDKSIGYFRAAVPVNMANEISRNRHVAAVAIESGVVYLSQSSQSVNINNDNAGQKVILDKYRELLKADTGYDWRSPLGLNEFWNNNRKFDGRGVTVAVIEYFMDPSSSQLKYSRSLDGSLLQKVREMRGFINKNDSDMDIPYYENSGHVRFKKVDTEKRKTIEYNGKNILLPSKGSFDLGHVELNYLLGRAPGAITDKSILQQSWVGVLRAGSSDCVIIDTNINNDFTDDECLEVYNKSGRGATIRLSVEGYKNKIFYVVPNNLDDSVILAVAHGHTHAVGLTIAGSDIEGGLSGGTAPNARLINLGVGGRLDEIIEAMIYASKNEEVDIIVQMISLPNLLNHGGLLYNIISDRISKIHNKVMVGPAGNNTKRLSAVLDMSTSERTLSVGQFYGGKQASLFLGRKIRDYVSRNSSGGPAADGALKPDFVSPSLVLVEIPDYLGHDSSVRNRASCPNLDLPNNIHCYSGTSAAAPSLAGVAGVLISASKQKGMTYDAKTISDALRYSARFIDGEAAYIQGRGIVNINEAFSYLRKLSKFKEDIGEAEIDAPVSTALSSELMRPSRGRGLYEVKGWSIKSQSTRDIIITRVSGNIDFNNYEVVWLGNRDGIFSGPSQLKIPVGKQTVIPVNIYAKSYGVHSAIIRIKEKNTSLVLTDISLTVVVPYEFGENNVEVGELSGQHSPDKPLSFYVRVPEDTLAFEVGGTPSGDMFIWFKGPFGQHVSAENLEGGAVNLVDRADGINSYRQAIFYPSPGLWEIMVENLGEVPKQAIKMSMYTKIIRRPLFKEVVAESKKNNDDIDFRYFRKYKVDRRIVRGSFIRGTIMKSSIGPWLIPVEFEAGAEILEAKVNNNSDGVADGIVLVSFLRCIEKRCFYMNSSGGPNKAGIFAFAPAEGKWFLVIDQAGIPDGSAIDYEVFARYDSEKITTASDAGVTQLADVSVDLKPNLSKKTNICNDNIRGWFWEDSTKFINIVNYGWFAAGAGFLPTFSSQEPIVFRRKSISCYADK